MLYEYNSTNRDFCLERVRMRLEARVAQRFGEGRAGNIVRGALGWAMRESSPEAYARYFEPRQLAGAGPSGFANPPRPFVLRAHHLDGKVFEPGEHFWVELHLFCGADAGPFADAFGRAPLGELIDVTRERIAVRLENRGAGVGEITVRFVTPTELKADGAVVPDPAFAVVFARAWDRIRALGGHSLAPDLDGMAERARKIALPSHTLRWHRQIRTSRKTGQAHPIGGFTGDAVYAGQLDEFLPFLEAAQWTGIGRQTVWGKGVIEVVIRT